SLRPHHIVHPGEGGFQNGSPRCGGAHPCTDHHPGYPYPPTPTPSVVATVQHAPTIRRRADPTPAPARPPSTRRPADINGVVQPDGEHLGGHIGERQAGLDRDPTALVLQLLPAGSAEPRRRRLDGARTGEQWLLYAVGRLPFRPGATLSALITAISPKFGIRVR